MVLTGRDNIRDVIAFPKTQSAVDPLFEAPSPVEPEQLEELGISIVARGDDAVSPIARVGGFVVIPAPEP